MDVNKKIQEIQSNNNKQISSFASQIVQLGSLFNQSIENNLSLLSVQDKANGEILIKNLKNSNIENFSKALEDLKKFQSEVIKPALETKEKEIEDKRKKEINDLKKNYETQSQELQTEINTLKNEKNSITEEKALLDSEIITLKDEVKNLSTEKALLTTNNQTLSDTINSKQEKILELETSSNELKTKMKTLEEKNEALEKEKKDLNDSFNEIKNKSNTLQSNNDSLKETILSNTKKIQDLETNKETLETKLQDQNVLLNQIELLKKDKLDLDENSIKLKDEISNLKTEYINLVNEKLQFLPDEKDQEKGKALIKELEESTTNEDIRKNLNNLKSFNNEIPTILSNQELLKINKERDEKATEFLENQKSILNKFDSDIIKNDVDFENLRNRKVEILKEIKDDNKTEDKILIAQKIQALINDFIQVLQTKPREVIKNIEVEIESEKSKQLSKDVQELVDKRIDELKLLIKPQEGESTLNPKIKANLEKLILDVQNENVTLKDQVKFLEESTSILDQKKTVDAIIKVQKDILTDSLLSKNTTLKAKFDLLFKNYENGKIDYEDFFKDYNLLMDQFSKNKGLETYESIFKDALVLIKEDDPLYKDLESWISKSKKATSEKEVTKLITDATTLLSNLKTNIKYLNEKNDIEIFDDEFINEMEEFLIDPFEEKFSSEEYKSSLKSLNERKLRIYGDFGDATKSKLQKQFLVSQGLKLFKEKAELDEDYLSESMDKEIQVLKGLLINPSLVNESNNLKTFAEKYQWLKKARELVKPREIIKKEIDPKTATAVYDILLDELDKEYKAFFSLSLKENSKIEDDSRYKNFLKEKEVILKKSDGEKFQFYKERSEVLRKLKQDESELAVYQTVLENVNKNIKEAFKKSSAPNKQIYLDKWNLEIGKAKTIEQIKRILESLYDETVERLIFGEVNEEGVFFAILGTQENKENTGVA